MHWWHIIQHWLAYQTGSQDLSGVPPHYNFWSGFGSDIGEVTIIAGLVTVYKKHNCHVKWCWRIAHHKFTEPGTGVEYMLCRVHHPDIPHKHLTRAHLHLYIGRQPGKG